MLRKQAIAVFDSGVGGISVLKKLIEYMPQENFLYFGDSANAPYGDRPTEQVRALTLAAADRLFSQDVKALVVACNTATSVAIEDLRQKYPDTVIVGIEPAVKPAVERFPTGCIGVMATLVTLREEKLSRQIAQYPDAEILRIPVPGLVDLVETDRANSPEAEALLQKALLPYAHRLDALVLGCTHYPFSAPTIRKILGQGISLFDGGTGTARRTKQLLSQRDLLNESGNGSVCIQNSGGDARTVALCMHLLNTQEDGENG